MTAGNVKEVVPFLAISDMERSLRYYCDGLGFEIRYRWLVEDEIRWCWLTLGSASLMLQQFHTKGHDSWKPSGKVGDGVSLCLICDDAIAFYDDIRSRGIDAPDPQVGNSMWVVSLSDPDGYSLNFESMTDTPEETKLSEFRRAASS